MDESALRQKLEVPHRLGDFWRDLLGWDEVERDAVQQGSVQQSPAATGGTQP